VQVRRPAAGKPGRKAFVSGKRRQNTIKTTTFTDGQGRTLFSWVARPVRMHGQTAVRTEGIADQLRQHPEIHADADEGYRGLASEFPKQVGAPLNAEYKQWRPLKCYTGLREEFADI